MQHARERVRWAQLVAVVVAFAGLAAIPWKLDGAAPSAERVSTPRRLAAPAPAMPVGAVTALGAEPADLLADDSGIDEAASSLLPPSSDPAAGPGEHVKAVVVGVNSYPDGNDLRSAVTDADDMAAALARWGVPASNVVLLEDQAASAPGIVAALRWLVANTGPDDIAVVSFAGHARTLAPGRQAIVASDGGLLTDQHLARLLAPLPAQQAWIVLATCYGGGFDELRAPGRILTAAADEHSVAYENESFGRSYLGEYLVHRGLAEGMAGGPTVQQAVAWATAYLQRDAPSRQLTTFDDSTAPVSLDGVPRSAVPAPAPLPAEVGPGADAPPQSAPQPAPSQPAPPPPSSPPPGQAATPPPAEPAPCHNAISVLCPTR